MQVEKVTQYLRYKQNHFPDTKTIYLKEKLLASDEKTYALLLTIPLRNPKLFFFISLFFGLFGLDRFLLGEFGMGVLKLLTFGFCGFVLLYDWLTIQNQVKEKNFHKVMLYI